MEHLIVDELWCCCPLKPSRFVHFTGHAIRTMMTTIANTRDSSVYQDLIMTCRSSMENPIVQRRPTVSEIPDEFFGLSRYRRPPMKLYPASSFPSSSAVVVVLNSDASLQPNAVALWRNLRGRCFRLSAALSKRAAACMTDFQLSILTVIVCIKDE